MLQHFTIDEIVNFIFLFFVDHIEVLRVDSFGNENEFISAFDVLCEACWPDARCEVRFAGLIDKRYSNVIDSIASSVTVESDNVEL